MNFARVRLKYVNMRDFRFNEMEQNEVVVGRYVDLLTNSGFKAVFGDRDTRT